MAQFLAEHNGSPQAFSQVGLAENVTTSWQRANGNEKDRTKIYPRWNLVRKPLAPYHDWFGHVHCLTFRRRAGGFGETALPVYKPAVSETALTVT